MRGGILTIRGANDYKGGTIVTGGLINFASAANFGTPASQPSILLNGGGLQWATGTSTDISADLDPIGSNGATFDTNGNNVSFATALSGTGSVTKAGAGVLTFTQPNTYGGGTIVTGGLINFANATAFGTPGSQPSILLNGGGLQWATNNTTDISADLQPIGANGATFDTNGNNVSFATALSGTGGLTKLGAGTLTLGVTENYSGATVVSGGVLSVTGSILSSVSTTVSNGGTLEGNGMVSALVVAHGGGMLVSPGVGTNTGHVERDGQLRAQRHALHQCDGRRSLSGSQRGGDYG